MNGHAAVKIEIKPEDRLQLVLLSGNLVLEVNKILDEEFKEHEHDETDEIMDHHITFRIYDAIKKLADQAFVNGAIRAAQDSVTIMRDQQQE